MEMAAKRNKQTVDRLSSLPDDLLIGIISFLPLQFAIVTGSLSRRWRGLWTKVTSININDREFLYFLRFMTHITSPSIDCFNVKCKLILGDSFWRPIINDWLRQACDRNVRQLKLECPGFCTINSMPGFLLKTQSLISVEFCLQYDLQLPDDGEINLPNLKRLRLKHSRHDQLDLLGTLIKACPSLEDLSLNFFYMTRCDIKVFNRSLRRLVIETNYIPSGLVLINAPKLEQLVCRTVKSVMFRFEEKPSVLRAVEIETIPNKKHLSEDECKVLSEFYGAISNVSFLTLDDFLLDNMSTVFKATHVTLVMRNRPNMEIVSSLIEICPLLDVLTLKVEWDISTTREMIPPNLNRISMSQRVLKRVEIKAYWYTSREPAESFLKLVRYLLSGVIELKQFHVRIIGEKNRFTATKEELRQRMELNLCKLLCKYRKAIRGCEVEFVGIYHTCILRESSPIKKVEM